MESATIGKARDLGAPEAPCPGRVVLDPDALRFREDRAVVKLHAVRQASVRRLVALVALRSVGAREVNQVENASRRVGAGTGVEVLPARPRNLARWIRQVQFIETIGGGTISPLKSWESADSC